MRLETGRRPRGVRKSTEVVVRGQVSMRMRRRAAYRVCYQSRIFLSEHVSFQVRDNQVLFYLLRPDFILIVGCIPYKPNSYMYKLTGILVRVELTD